MQKITNYCDGCGKKLEGGKLEEARVFTAQFNTEFDRSEQSIFCAERCRRSALDYWSESRDITFKALAVAAKTIESHKRKFFNSSSLREVV